MSTPSVSVIIPTYGHSDYVLEALESVFAQSFTDFEVIVVNDGSPDDTASKLAPLASTGRIKYIEQPNQGQSAARNHGLRLASGRFIAFLDDDDIWPSDKLEWQIAYLESTPPAVLIAGGAEYINSSGLVTGENKPKQAAYVHDDFFAGNPFESPGQTLIRTTTLRRIRGLRSDVCSAEDLCLYFRLAREGQLHARDKISLRYRIHAGNASANLTKMFTSTWRLMDRELNLSERKQRKLLARVAQAYVYAFPGRILLREVLSCRGGLHAQRWRDRLPVAATVLEWAARDATLRQQLLAEVIRPAVRRGIFRRPPAGTTT